MHDLRVVSFGVMGHLPPNFQFKSDVLLGHHQIFSYIYADLSLKDLINKL